MSSAIKKNYHDRAEGDIKTAKILISPISNPTNDEVINDNAAYHVQQAVEKELKYILHDILGEDDTTRKFKTHDIADIINQIEEKGYEISEDIKEIAYDLSEWETTSRYGTDIVASREEIINVIELYDVLVTNANEILREVQES